MVTRGRQTDGSTSGKRSSRFEVTAHFEISDRGSVVVGHIRTGVVKIGDLVHVPDRSITWTISGIECLDNVSERKYWNALLFRENPGLAEIKEAFPVGSYIQTYEPASSEDTNSAG